LLFPKAVSEGLWHPHAYIGGGGLCLSWYRDSILQLGAEAGKISYADLDSEAAQIPPGADKLLFIPHLGGRSNPCDSDMRGAWAGLSWSHKRGHFYRSILESIAYEYEIYLSIERELFPEIQFREVHVIGGGAKSQIFNQIKADVLGIPYVEVDCQEVACLGSALIAGKAAGVFENIEKTALAFTKTKNRIEPNPQNYAVYHEYAGLYREMMKDLKPFYRRLSKQQNSSGF
jgi:xylulokinase